MDTGSQNQLDAEAERVYATLMQQRSLASLPDETAVRQIGQLVDASTHLGHRDGLLRVIDSWGPQLAARDMPAPLRFAYYYDLGNAWAELRVLQEREARSHWEWEQAERVQALRHYRLAWLAAEGEGAALPARGGCQLLTNMGNMYDIVGRFVAAIECWGKAIAVDPDFGMALGNRGCGLIAYAHAHYDQGHEAMLLYHAREDLRRAVQVGVEPHARQHFQSRLHWLDGIWNSVPDHVRPQASESDLGASDEERAYRQWCLRNCLFLNALNDLGPLSVAARDILHLPPIVASIGDMPRYHQFYNTIKQEYVSSRYLLYEATTADEPHFSDREVMQYNTLDYPCLSLHTEKAKIAYRVAYSLLDKVAYFINAYLGLGVAENVVNFRRVWYCKGERKQGLNPLLNCLRNRPLRALFWLSKDLCSDDHEFRDAIEPDAADLVAVRNHLEHKNCSIQDLLTDEGTGPQTCAPYRISRREFMGKTLRLMRIVRAALIYLSLALHNEEQRRKAARGPTGLIPKVGLDIYEDEWKR